VVVTQSTKLGEGKMGHYSFSVHLNRVLSWLLVTCSLFLANPGSVFAQLSGSGSTQNGGSILVDFGEVQVGSTKVHYLTLTASEAVTLAGNAAPSPATATTNDMAVDTSTLGSGPFSMLPEDDGCRGKSLVAAGSCVIVLRFTPNAAESSYAGYVKVRTSVPANYPGFYVNLKGKGITGGAGSSPVLTISGSACKTPTSAEIASDPFVVLSCTMTSVGGNSAAMLLSLKATGGNVGIVGTGVPVGWSFDTKLCGDSVTKDTTCTAVVRSPDSASATFETLVVQASNKPHHVKVELKVTEKASETPGTLVITPSSLDFGSLRPGRTSVKTVTLTASGSNVAFEKLEVPEGYSATHSCGTLIPKGTSCSAAITFAPKAVVPYLGSAIFSTAATGSPHSVTLLGEGSSSTTGSTGSGTSGGPLLTLDSAYLEFGEVVTGASSQKTVKLSNRGGSTLSASLLASGEAFTVSGTCISPNSVSGTSATVSLAAASVCTLSINFSAKSLGEQTGSLMFSGTGADGISVRMKGNGTATGSTVSMSGLSATPSAIMFGAVTVDSSSIKTISLTKANGAKPNLGSISVPTGYIYQHDCVSSVSNTCTLTLIFAPSSVSTYNGLVIVNDVDGASSLITVTGEGTATVQMTARTRMAEAQLDVTGQFVFAANKVASAGNLYVAVMYKEALYFMSSGQWIPYVPGQEPPAYTTADASSNELTILVNQNVSAMSGAVLFLGYGQNIAEVINQHQYTPVHVID
jgi:hypothetical protein